MANGMELVPAFVICRRVYLGFVRGCTAGAILANGSLFESQLSVLVRLYRLLRPRHWGRVLLQLCFSLDLFGADCLCGFVGCPFSSQILYFFDLRFLFLSLHDSNLFRNMAETRS